jgi:hypothetical protein
MFVYAHYFFFKQSTFIIVPYVVSELLRLMFDAKVLYFFQIHKKIIFFTIIFQILL